MPITLQLQPVTRPQWMFGMKTPSMAATSCWHGNGVTLLPSTQWGSRGKGGWGGGGGIGSTVVFSAGGFGFGGLSVAEWGCSV